MLNLNLASGYSYNFGAPIITGLNKINFKYPATQLPAIKFIPHIRFVQ